MNNFYTANIEMYKYVHQDYETTEEYADSILQEAKRNKNSIQIDREDFVLVTTLLWEPHLLDDFKLYKNLFDSFNHKKIKTILILDSYYKDKNVDGLATKIYYINYFLWRTYNKIVRQKKCEFNTEWNSNANKFLILNGKPGRIHRIRLLWKLESLLSKSIWSLHVHPGTWQESHSCIPELNNQEFEMFVGKYNNNPDGAKIVFQENSLHYGGIPYDASLFKNSLFRIITETTFNTNKNTLPWLTEKTFITILNNLPFIMAGDRYSLNKLKKLGFLTFENFLPIPNYDEIEDPEKKLDAIVTNTEFWINNMKDKEDVKQNVIANYNRINELALQNKKILENICIEYGIAPHRIEEICTTYDILGNE